MPGVLQFIHGDAVEGGRAVVDDLVALLQRGRVLIDLTSSDQKQFITWSLDVHEVVLEGKRNVDCSFVDCLGVEVVLVNEFRVSFENVNMACLGSSCRLQQFGCSSGFHNSIGLLGHCRSSGRCLSTNYKCTLIGAIDTYL